METLDVSTNAAFPASGSIEYEPRWKEIKRGAGCNKDNGMIADDFRKWCAAKSIKLDAANIETLFGNYCKKVGKV